MTWNIGLGSTAAVSSTLNTHKNCVKKERKCTTYSDIWMLVSYCDRWESLLRRFMTSVPRIRARLVRPTPTWQLNSRAGSFWDPLWPKPKLGLSWEAQRIPGSLITYFQLDKRYNFKSVFIATVWQICGDDIIVLVRFTKTKTQKKSMALRLWYTGLKKKRKKSKEKTWTTFRPQGTGPAALSQSKKGQNKMKGNILCEWRAGWKTDKGRWLRSGHKVSPRSLFSLNIIFIRDWWQREDGFKAGLNKSGFDLLATSLRKSRRSAMFLSYRVF